ncbi:MAG: hypothetical protein AAFY56_17315 [Pseudomonadota bacterium]
MDSQRIATGTSILLALGLAFFGIQKFGAENIVFETLSTRSGISLFEPGLRIATGLAEIGAALLLIVPRTRLLGTLAALGIVGGAIVFHLSPWLGINVPMIGHGLFFTAVFLFALSLLNLSMLLRFKSLSYNALSEA